MPSTEIRVCKTHGETVFIQEGRGYFRCRQCRIDRVTERRREVKRILVEEAGGHCVRCGYDRCIAAFHFHHRDPATKEFGIAKKGATYSMARLRAEAAKCDLVCSNCHAEIEAGINDLV